MGGFAWFAGTSGEAEAALPDGVPADLFGAGLLHWYRDGWNGSECVDLVHQSNTMVATDAGREPATGSVNGHDTADWDGDDVVASSDVTTVDGLTELTIFGCFKAPPAQNAYGCIIGKLYSATCIHVGANPTGDRLMASVGSSFGVSDAESDADPFDDTWHRFIYVWEAANGGTLYIDGSPQLTQEPVNESAVPDNAEFMSMGGVTVDNTAAWDYHFAGETSNVGIGGRALGSVEIATLDDYLEGWISNLDQTISDAGAIATAEAFGTDKVNLVVAPSGIATAEAHGTGKLVLYAVPTGIATAEAFGTAALHLKIDATGIASAEAFGTTVLGLYLLASGIATEEAHGSPNVVMVLLPAGLASAEAFGTLQANLTAYPEGKASDEAHGTPTLVLYARPTAIPSDEAHGTGTVIPGAVTVSPTGIASDEAFGTTTLVLALLPSSIASEEAHGTPQINLGVAPSAIASDEAFGSALFTLFVLPSAIDSEEAHGDAALEAGVATLRPTAIDSEEAFGTTALALVILPSAIESEEAHGTAEIREVQTLSGVGAIASAEALGTPHLDLVLQALGAESAEAFGDAGLGLHVVPVGIASSEAHGSPSLTSVVILAPSSVPSDEAFGTPALARTLTAVGIESDEAFGTPSVVVVLSPVGIGSAEAFGTPRLNLAFQPPGIASAEAFGLPAIAIPVSALIRIAGRPTTRIRVRTAPVTVISVTDRPTTRIRIMSAFDIYDVGDSSEHTMTFEIATGLEDPDALSVVVKHRPPKNSGIAQKPDETFVYGVDPEIVRDAKGTYRLIHDDDTAGEYSGFITSTGAAKGAEAFFWKVRQPP